MSLGNRWASLREPRSFLGGKESRPQLLPLRFTCFQTSLMSSVGLRQEPGLLNRWCWREVVSTEHEANTGAFYCSNPWGTKGKFEENVFKGQLRSWNFGSPRHCSYGTIRHILFSEPREQCPDQQWWHRQVWPKVVVNCFHQTPVLEAANAACSGPDSPRLSPQGTWEYHWTLINWDRGALNVSQDGDHWEREGNFHARWDGASPQFTGDMWPHLHSSYTPRWQSRRSKLQTNTNSHNV